MKGAAVDDEAIRVPGTAPEDPIVTLGSGVLGHTSFERHTGRYGAVHLTVLDSIPGELAPARTVPVPPDEDLGARILQDLAKSDARYADTAAAASEAAARRPDNRVVAFDHAPRGTAGTLVAHVIANVSAYDWAMISPNYGCRSRVSGWCLDREPCSPKSTGKHRSSGYAPMTAARTTGWTATRSAGARITSSAWNSRCQRTARLAQQPPSACRRRARKAISRNLLSGLARSASLWRTRLLRPGRRRASRLGDHARPERSPLLRRPRNGGGEHARTPRSRTPGSSHN
jgi:hypothetical protein